MSILIPALAVLAIVIACAILDVLGCFGPSDGAIDAYYILKEEDPERANKFLRRILGNQPCNDQAHRE